MKAKPAKNTKFIRILMQISQTLTILLSFWAAMMTYLCLGENFLILLYADGYKPAVFTINELKFREAYTTSSGLQTKRVSAKYWAVGEIAGNKEKFGLKGFIEGEIKSLADLEKELSVGQQLQVLYNSDISEKLGIRIQYPEKDFKKLMKRRQLQIIKVAYCPWAVMFCLYLYLGFLTKRYTEVLIVTMTSLFFIGIVWAYIIFTSYNPAASIYHV
ncbi:MAG: hypothetical protein GY749_11555 [Desulfobacteraceae bacterium]|nr:hypothetical protein [Desulfobacteraceae bacterium]